MKTTTALSFALATAMNMNSVLAKTPTPVVQKPSALPIPGQLTPQGCFTSYGNATLGLEGISVSQGECKLTCEEKYPAMILNVQECYCANFYPPQDDLVKDSNCNYPCPSFPLEACGGLKGFYGVFNLGGAQLDVPDYVPETTAAPEPTTVPGSTSDSPSTGVNDGATGQTSDANLPTPEPEKDDGPNVAAIAAGTVIAVVVVGAALGAMYFFMRRRRNAEIEEEHRRNAAVNAFISGSKPPSSHGSISMADSRLDPVMAHRRLSDGSIADNHDYSRKILRVTNA